MSQNILVIGSGGREHALCWKIRQSPLCGELYCSPGNGGIREVAECIALDSQQAIVDFCRKQSIALVVIGPEQPLVEGLSDVLRAAGIPCFGCSQQAAQLEGSKAFTKALCKKYDIPTADYEEFNDAATSKTYLNGKSYPQVIKADGLAGGKGVIIAQDEAEAIEAIDNMFSGSFGAAGHTIIIEEFLTGPELSYFALCDGHTALEFGTAQDHKRAFDGDQGPNTGGMGTYSPPPIATSQLCAQVMREIIQPTLSALNAEGIVFRGIFFAGLMLTPAGPKLLEYNVRFGDPETQSLMMRLDSDLLPLLMDCATGQLAHNAPVRYKPQSAVCVVMASNGYPGSYEKGSVIRGLDQAAKLSDVCVFHAGTVYKDGNIQAHGGRVLGITALGDTLKQAQALAYEAVETIDWPEGFCRRDIAAHAI